MNRNRHKDRHAHVKNCTSDSMYKRATNSQFKYLARLEFSKTNGNYINSHGVPLAAVRESVCMRFARADDYQPFCVRSRNHDENALGFCDTVILATNPKKRVCTLVHSTDIELSGQQMRIEWNVIGSWLSRVFLSLARSAMKLYYDVNVFVHNVL